MGVPICSALQWQLRTFWDWPSHDLVGLGRSSAFGRLMARRAFRRISVQPAQEHVGGHAKSMAQPEDVHESWFSTAALDLLDGHQATPPGKFFLRQFGPDAKLCQALTECVSQHRCLVDANRLNHCLTSALTHGAITLPYSRDSASRSKTPTVTHVTT